MWQVKGDHCDQVQPLLSSLSDRIEWILFCLPKERISLWSRFLKKREEDDESVMLVPIEMALSLEMCNIENYMWEICWKLDGGQCYINMFLRWKLGRVHLRLFYYLFIVAENTSNIKYFNFLLWFPHWVFKIFYIFKI